jgi:hypothetical protein
MALIIQDILPGDPLYVDSHGAARLFEMRLVNTDLCRSEKPDVSAMPTSDGNKRARSRQTIVGCSKAQFVRYTYFSIIHFALRTIGNSWFVRKLNDFLALIRRKV